MPYLVAIGYKGAMLLYDKAKMEWIQTNRSSYILKKFGGANTADKFTDTIRSCAVNIQHFNVSQLTTLWKAMNMYWVTDIGLVAVLELLEALKGREMDIVKSLSEYFKRGRYDKNTHRSFLLFKKSLAQAFKQLSKDDCTLVLMALKSLFPDDDFPDDLPDLCNDLFSISELAYVTASIETSSPEEKYRIVLFMLERTKSDFQRHDMKKDRTAIVKAHSLLGEVPHDTARRKIAGLLYIFFGNHNIEPSGLGLDEQTIMFLSTIQHEISDPRLGQGQWIQKARLPR